jgi:hypothetical protein
VDQGGKVPPEKIDGPEPLVQVLKDLELRKYDFDWAVQRGSILKTGIVDEPKVGKMDQPGTFAGKVIFRCNIQRSSISEGA